MLVVLYDCCTGRLLAQDRYEHRDDAQSDADDRDNGGGSNLPVESLALLQRLGQGRGQLSVAAGRVAARSSDSFRSVRAC